MGRNSHPMLKTVGTQTTATALYQCVEKWMPLANPMRERCVNAYCAISWKRLLG